MRAGRGWGRALRAPGAARAPGAGHGRAGSPGPPGLTRGGCSAVGKGQGSSREGAEVRDTPGSAPRARGDVLGWGKFLQEKPFLVGRKSWMS